MKTLSFLADDSLSVLVDDGIKKDGAVDVAQLTFWSLSPGQISRHRVMFDSDMTPADKVKADAIKAKHP